MNGSGVMFIIHQPETEERRRLEDIGVSKRLISNFGTHSCILFSDAPIQRLPEVILRGRWSIYHRCIDRSSLFWCHYCNIYAEKNLSFLRTSTFVINSILYILRTFCKLRLSNSSRRIFCAIEESLFSWILLVCVC